MANANQVYVDNAIQYGSIKVAIQRGQTTAGATLVGTYILDNVTVNRAVKKTEQSDEIGGPNGWAMVAAQCDGSCVIQIGPATNAYPQNGDWFEVILDTTAGTERWVFGPISQPFEVNGYYKSNATLTKAHFRS
jgi:hypothetical protein